MNKHTPTGIVLFLCSLFILTAQASAYVDMVTGSMLPCRSHRPKKT